MGNDVHPTLLTRLREAPLYYANGLYQEISTKNVFLFAQAIAFKVMVTIVPVVILAAGVTGRVFRNDAGSFEQIRTLLEDFLPSYQSDQLLEFMRRLLDASGTFTLVGAIGLLLSALTLATTLRLAVGGAFRQEWHDERSIFGGYAFDLRMVVQVGFFFVLSILLTFAAQSLGSGGTAVFKQLGLDYVWISTGWRRVINALGLVIPFIVTTAMFFQLFYFVPVPHPPNRSALAGALVTAVLWEAAKFGFTFYARYVGRFDRYGGGATSSLGEDGMIALGSGFGLLIAFIFWVYYSGIVLMIGALVASLHERHRRIRRAEAEAADLQPEAVSKLETAAHQAPMPVTNDEDDASGNGDDGARQDGNDPTDEPPMTEVPADGEEAPPGPAAPSS